MPQRAENSRPAAAGRGRHSRAPGFLDRLQVMIAKNDSFVTRNVMTSPIPTLNPGPSEKASVNILLVDDEIRNLDVLESILLSPEYSLVRVDTAEKALLALLEGEFAAMVLD